MVFKVLFFLEVFQTQCAILIFTMRTKYWEYLTSLLCTNQVIGGYVQNVLFVKHTLQVTRRFYDLDSHFLSHLSGFHSDVTTRGCIFTTEFCL